jgi:hypothetical protein
MQQTEEEMHSNAKSFYIQIQKPEGTTTPQQILYCNKLHYCESSSNRRNKDGKERELFVINQEISNTEA